MKPKPAKKPTETKLKEKSHVAKNNSASGVDWDGAENDYRAGQLSNVEIGKRRGVSETAIRKRAKQYGWKKDLAEKVKKQVREKLVRDVAVRTDNAKATKGNDVSDEEIINAAADRGAEVVRLHRKDIQNLRRLEESLINELQNEPTKLYIAQYQGTIIQKTVNLTVAERSMAANNLANVQHKRIALERQAYNLNDTGGDDDPVEKIQLEFV